LVGKPSHPILRNLGVVIRQLRRQKALSQEALADLAQIDRSYMSSVERGLRNISVLNLARIATALQVPLSDLLYLRAAAIEPVASPTVALSEPVERFRRVSVAVEELAESLRLHQTRAGRGVGTPSVSDEADVEWKPGFYLSLS
jgi:transcriptional regulator with XRE-family HTH domain